MATIDGLTKVRMLAIEAASVVSGLVSAGHLILTKHDGSTIDAGSVIGPTGATGPTGGVGPTGPAGSITVSAATTDTDSLTGLAARDGYTPTAGDQILVTNQATVAQNGIYTAAAGAWSRWSAATTALQISSLGVVQVRHGLVNGGSRFVTTFSQDNTVGTSDQYWLKLDASHATDYTMRTADLTGGFSSYAEGASGGIAMSYPFPGYYKDEVGVVHALGLLLNVGAIAVGTTIFNFPKGFRPAKTLRFICLAFDQSRTVLVRPNGDVIMAGAITSITTGTALAAGSFLSIDSIHFPAEDVPNPPVWTDLTSLLINGWQNVGTVGTDTYANIRMWMDPLGDTHVQGVIKNATTTSSLQITSSTPAAFHTQGSYAQIYIAAGAFYAGNSRVDYHGETTTGELQLAGYTSPGDNTAVSLDNIIIPTSKNPSKWKKYGAFANGWANYAGAPYGIPQLYRNPLGRVYNRGLVAGGSPSVTFGPQFNAADWIAPRGNTIFCGVAYIGSCRIDGIPGGITVGGVNVSGYVNGGTNAFASLTDVTWDTRQR